MIGRLLKSTSPRSSGARREHVQVCIIGSGAGGAVAAYEAAQRGLSTLVLERGPRVRPEDMLNDELRMIPRLYKDGGFQMNSSLNMFIMQGTCVGGSTVLSNMVMIRPEEQIFDTWRGLGAHLDQRSLAGGFDRVDELLKPSHPDQSTVSQTSKMFLKAAKELGREPEWMKKSLGECKGCGYCNVGCTFDTKQDAQNSYLRWAEELGARVLPEADVVKIRHRNGRARALDVRVGRGKERYEVTADVIIVAAGAIGSSSLLLRSGIRKNVGTRLSFNAGSMIIGEFNQPLDSFDADQMNVYLHDPDFLIEATHNPIMSSALTTPGFLEDHGRLMRQHRNLAFAGALVATEPKGEVFISKMTGAEEVRFTLSDLDMRRLRKGLRTIGEVFFQGGAKRIVLPTHELKTIEDRARLDELPGQIRQMREISVGSAHPQGGNPISDDPEIGAVDSNLAVHGFDNLFVCDSSVFPTSVGVNPIHSIMAVAHSRAPDIMARA